MSDFKRQRDVDKNIKSNKSCVQNNKDTNPKRKVLNIENTIESNVDQSIANKEIIMRIIVQKT